MSETIELYWTDALPEHYVAIDGDGSRWLIPVAPMSSEPWKRRKPYLGNYELQRVCPTAIERFYQPAAAKEMEEGAWARKGAAQAAAIANEAEAAWKAAAPSEEPEARLRYEEAVAEANRTAALAEATPDAGEQPPAAATHYPTCQAAEADGWMRLADAISSAAEHGIRLTNEEPSAGGRMVGYGLWRINGTDRIEVPTSCISLCETRNQMGTIGSYLQMVRGDVIAALEASVGE